ncbi:hypothetical protein DF19_12590 [Streptomyces olindensis]|nr:hypothetical protein DF19_12590 [Streptomyces olindensis]
METGVGIAAPFGRLLRELRQSRRLTIEELAEASGVSGRAIGDMERGRSRRPHRGTITALAQGLELDEATHARPWPPPAPPVPARGPPSPGGPRPTRCRGACVTSSAGGGN